LALLIAINAPPGMLTFVDPDPALALAGYENYLAVLSAPPLPTSSPTGSPSGGRSGGGDRSGGGSGVGKGGENKSLNLEVRHNSFSFPYLTHSGPGLLSRFRIPGMPFNTAEISLFNLLPDNCTISTVLATSATPYENYSVAN
jgi:hypothetical protein